MANVKENINYFMILLVSKLLGERPNIPLKTNGCKKIVLDEITVEYLVYIPNSKGNILTALCVHGQRRPNQTATRNTTAAEFLAVNFSQTGGV